MTEKLYPSTDVVFKLLLSRPENRPELIDLLSAILTPKNPIVSAELINPRVPKIRMDDQDASLDIFVRMKDYSVLFVKMYISRNNDVEERALYNLMLLANMPIKQGKKYEDLKPTVVISFLGMNHFMNTPDQYHHVFEMKERDRSSTLGSYSTIHFIEMIKVIDLLQRRPIQTNKSHLEQWVQFLANPYTDSSEKEAIQNIHISQCRDQLRELSLNREVQRIVLSREKQLGSLNCRIRTAREVGYLEGCEAVRAEIFRSFLSRPMEHNLPLNLVAEILGITRKELDKEPQKIAIKSCDAEAL